ncbi:hypothetical protein ACCAA_130023 [Candidatus Accumulibacter aalborgensis]|uniref:Uncharacterized protein n=1 Tax=Candidatus Accumulibacter aalborgensis TaxID=1860102 RepID=A0A1A8XH66_9PROT|nr:hypothetical protein ACCAA_130023 [Candidatus Accumulibacter aalborgensis]
MTLAGTVTAGGFAGLKTHAFRVLAISNIELLALLVTVGARTRKRFLSRFRFGLCESLQERRRGHGRCPSCNRCTDPRFLPCVLPSKARLKYRTMTLSCTR